MSEPAHQPIANAAMAHWQSRLHSAEQQALPANIPALFAQMAQAHPQQILLDMFEDAQQISYAEFDALSTRLAMGLRAAGVQPGMHVVVMLPNGLHWHLTWLAVLKLGAAVVPVNPTYTVRELEYVLADAQVKAWVLGTERAEVPDQLSTWPATLPRDRVWTAAARLGQACPWQALLDSTAPGDAADFVAAELGLETLANIQYTSGTTGFPKGCLLTHGYWLTLAQSACLMHPLPAADQSPLRRFFTAQPFFYMDPFWQLLMTATAGGTLLAAHKISASKFLGWLAEHHIEWAQLPELALKSLHTVDDRQLDLRQVFTFGWSAESRLAFEQR
ncbi:MAG: crotonobetaine/carnitine-CoA ligase, partial [Comamonadaceae bacterium]